MQIPRILLAVVSATVLLPAAIAQSVSQPSANLPRTMRMCGSDGHCQTLTWNDGHYNGRMNGQTEVGTTFGVVRWDRESVELIGIITKSDQRGDYATGIFTGKISGNGHSIDNGTDTWRAGIATGSIPITMSWNPGDQIIAAPSRAAVSLPTSMRLCSIGKCVALRLNGGSYDVFEENDLVNKTAIYKVSSFSSDSVFWELVVFNGLRAIVTGRVQGQTIADGKLTFINGVDGATAPLEVGWGDELMAVAPIAPPQQTASLGVPQSQVNPWALLFGLVLAAGMDGDGDHHNPDHVDCVSDPHWEQHGCISAGRAAQLNHQQ